MFIMFLCVRDLCAHYVLYVRVLCAHYVFVC